MTGSDAELLNREVRVKKRRICEWCAEPICAGERAHYRVYVWQGEFSRAWSHPECWEAMGLVEPFRLDEGWLPGDWRRGSTESVHD